MGMLALNRLMPLRRDRRRRRRHHRPQIRARSGGLIASTGKRKTSPCQQDDYDGDSQAGKIMRNSIPDLPEDILFRIQSFMSMREAARAACVSRAFLHSWRCHPNLIFNKDTIGLKRNAFGENFHGKIGRILRNHSGISLKTFQLDYSGMCGFDGTSYLDSWLQIALKPEIEELTLFLPETNRQYSFPCSLLSDGVRDSLRYIKLRCCALHPTPELGPLRSLSSMHLLYVSITWAELECLLSNSLALEHLELNHCKGIICLKIPCTLQQLSSLNVVECSGLKVIESKAPNLSSLFVRGSRVNFSLVETLQIKKLDMGRAICDARAKLPSIMPNLETLIIESGHEVVDAPMLPTKFLYLRHLTIHMITGSTISRPYDYFSLVSFIDASPSLETLILNVTQVRMVHESIFTDSQLRHIPGHRHGHLKSVKITGFSSAKSLVELTCYILNNAVSLECLTLDTIYGPRCDQDKYRRCFPMIDGVLTEAPRGLAAIRTYIEDKVPSTVNLIVLEPCSRCHVRRRG
ncbi:putative F-box/FBD/LRR-repeat protein At5g56810 isoform X1 [Oryza glaberrima]|uniref:putative F-box/FBD/LRR-repeat protein At5g56810 isoform X1 n=1 Tax=Oryza glaberrima TaxID=4538 RepID=UPI00224C32B3|nr:putative F-box/FBD/LRR-repeat protein At5g56810 isoform X1 [Oryza glaberrima]